MFTMKKQKMKNYEHVHKKARKWCLFMKILCEKISRKYNASKRKLSQEIDFRC